MIPRALTIPLACLALALAAFWVAPGTLFEAVADRNQEFAIALAIVSLSLAPAIVTAIVPRPWLLPWLALLAIMFLAMDYRVFASDMITGQTYTGQDFLFAIGAIPAHTVNFVAALLRFVIRPRTPSPN